MSQSALQQYKSTHVQTGSAEKLIVLLYEGAMRFCLEAQRAIGDGTRSNIPARSHALMRAKRIVQELNNSLDHEVGGELAGRLASLYDYVEYELTLANLENDPAHIERASRVLAVLLESWQRIARGEIDGAEAVDKLPARPAVPTAPSLSLSC